MTKSDQVKQGILNCLKQIPEELLKKAIKEGFYIVPTEAMDTLTTAYIEGLDTLSVLKNTKIEGMHTLSRPSIDPSIYMDSNKDKDNNKNEDKDLDSVPSDFSKEKSDEPEIPPVVISAAPPGIPLWDMTPEQRENYYKIRNEKNTIQDTQAVE